MANMRKRRSPNQIAEDRANLREWILESDEHEYMTIRGMAKKFGISRGAMYYDYVAVMNQLDELGDCDADDVEDDADTAAQPSKPLAKMSFIVVKAGFSTNSLFEDGAYYPAFFNMDGSICVCAFREGGCSGTNDLVMRVRGFREKHVSGEHYFSRNCHGSAEFEVVHGVFRVGESQ